MPFTIEKNVALREQICQKIGSERVNIIKIGQIWIYIISFYVHLLLC